MIKLKHGHESRNKNIACYGLTGVDDGDEREGAGLNIEGEFVNVHPAGADQHLVVLNQDGTITVNSEKGTWRSFVLFYPVEQRYCTYTNKY